MSISEYSFVRAALSQRSTLVGAARLPTHSSIGCHR